MAETDPNELLETLDFALESIGFEDEDERELLLSEGLISLSSLEIGMI